MMDVLIKTDYQTVLKEIQKGGTASEISEKTGISRYWVHKIAKLYKIRVALPPKKTNPLKDQIIQRVLETGNGYLVDREFGLSLGKSKKICRQNGVDYEIRLGRQRSDKSVYEKLEDFPIWGRIHEAYLSGKNLREIEAETGMRYAGVGRILKKFGIEIGKGNNNPRKVFLPDSVGEMYLNGMSEKEIGEQFGVSRKVVRRKLLQLKTPKRVGKAEGSKNPQWKGGKERTVHKYRRQVYEVVAICLKRPLQEGRVIHHIDENPKNNDPHNLMIFPSSSFHAKFHQKVLKSRWKVDSEEAIRFALENGGVLLPIPDFQIEL